MTKLRALALGLAVVGCHGDDGRTDEAADSSDDGSTSVAPTTGDATGATDEGDDSGSSDVEPDGSGDSSSGGASGYLDVYDIDGDAVFPEGVAFDPVGEAFFFGSLEDGVVRRMDVEGNQTDFAMPPGAAWSGSGLKVDADNGRVWACARDTAADGIVAILVFDLDTGASLETFDLTAGDPDAGCNDLTLDAAGVAYVTDPPLGVVHRLQSGGSDEHWASSPDWASTAGLGLNGLAATPDGGYLVVAFYTPPTLYRVALDDPTDIVAVTLSGDAFAGGTALAGADGIIFDEDALYVVFADVVKRVDFTDDWTTGTVGTYEVPGAGSGLSTATVAGGAVYVVKSEVSSWILGSDPDLPFRIIEVPGT